MSDDQDAIDFYSDFNDGEPSKLQKQPKRKKSSIQLVQQKDIKTPVTQAANYPQISEKTLPVLTKIPSQIKVNQFEMQQSDMNQIDLTNSFQSCNRPQISQQNTSVDQPNIGLSIHLYSQQITTRYISSQQSQEIYKQTQPINMTKKRPSEQSKSSIPLNQSIKQQKIPSPTKMFSKKKQSSPSSISSEKNLNDSIQNMNLPVANNFKGNVSLNGSSSSKNSSDSSQKRYLRQIQYFSIDKSSKEITFILYNKTEIKKQITQAYLQYIEKYFFNFYNILLPMHINQILQSPFGVQTYLKIYFDYILNKYQSRLLEFLQRSNFKQPTTIPTNPQNNLTSNLHTKFQEYKNILFNTFSSGYDIVQSAVKKIKGQNFTPIRLLQKIFFKQIQMAQIHNKSRDKIENVIGSKNPIHASAYQQGDIQNKQYILMCLRWLVGFQMTTDLIKQRQVKAEPVQNQKLEMLLNDFTAHKQRQQRDKMKLIQQKVKLIYR